MHISWARLTPEALTFILHSCTQHYPAMGKLGPAEMQEKEGGQGQGQGGSPSIFGAPNSEHGFDLVLSSQVPLCTALPYMVLPQPVQTHIYTF